MPKQRILWIDIARTIAIFLVCWGHTASGTISNTIYTFHMPLFFIISGMLLKTHHAERIGYSIKKRFYSVIIPYLIWGLFYSSLSLRNLLKLLYGSREMLKEIASLTSLWFLPVLFLATVITEMIISMTARKKYGSLLCFVWMSLLWSVGFLLPHSFFRLGWPFGLDISFVAAGFMIMGIFAKKLAEWLLRKRQVVCRGLFFVLSAVWLIFYRNMPQYKVGMYKGSYGNEIVFLVNAILGSATVLLFALGFQPKNLRMRNLFSMIGENTFGIYVLHKPIVKFIASISERYGISMRTMAPSVSVAFMGGGLALLFTMVIDKIAPYLLGKRKV